MYCQFYGFREKPFSLLPDPEFLFLSQKHEKALNLLELGILNQSGFCVISGEIGAGKTTLVRELLNRLDERVRVGLISNTHSAFSDLLGWILAAYEIKPESNEAAVQHRRFTDFIIEQYAGGKHTLLIIDEAQNLTLSALEQLRMLSNINSEKDLVLQIILVGQNELRTKLQRPELEQFAQRIAIDYHLAALDQEETAAYIDHRVTKSGGSSGLFDNDACGLVYHYSKGIPRLINLICDFSLVYGFSEDREIIGADLVKAVIADQVSGKSVKTPVKVPADKQIRVVRPDSGPVAGSSATKQKATSGQTRQSHGQVPQQTIISARTESVATGKNSISRTLVERSKADAALAEKAKGEKIAAERLASEKEAAEKTAVELAETSRTTAKIAEAEKLNAEKRALKFTSTMEQTTDLVTRKKLTAEQLVVEKVHAEEEALKKAASAKTAADKALAKRIAVEESATKIMAAANAQAREATAVRVAAELAAASAVADSETAVQYALDRQAQAARVVAEKVTADKAAMGKARADTELAKKACAEKEAASAAARERTMLAQQAAQKAAASRSKAEKALSDMATANARANEKASLKNVALAKVAAAKQATEKAAAAQKVARIKEAAAIKATRLAAEANALAEEATKAATGKQPQIQATQVKQRWTTRGRVRAALALSIITGIMAASLWLITRPGDTGIDTRPPVIADKSFTSTGPTTEAAALESAVQ